MYGNEHLARTWPWHRYVAQLEDGWRAELIDDRCFISAGVERFSHCALPSCSRAGSRPTLFGRTVALRQLQALLLAFLLGLAMVLPVFDQSAFAHERRSNPIESARASTGSSVGREWSCSMMRA
jgi:hypothetical protein